jgi:vancomycin permeability regulator SanA
MPAWIIKTETYDPDGALWMSRTSGIRASTLGLKMRVARRLMNKLRSLTARQAEVLPNFALGRELQRVGKRCFYGGVWA